MFTPDTRVRRKLNVSWQDIEGETVLLAGEKLMGLNPVAARVWQMMDGSRTPAQIAGEIARDFEGVPGRIQEDVLTFVRTLADRGLVDVSAA